MHRGQGDDFRRLVIFLLVIAIHVLLFLWAARSVITRLSNPESLVLLNLAPSAPAEPPTTVPLAAASSAATQRGQLKGTTSQAAPPKPPLASPNSPDSQLISIAPQAPDSPPEPPAIDWRAEAGRTAQHQADLALARQPRALDKHGTGTDFDGGLGPDHAKKPAFGWDRTHTHRVEGIEGGGLLLHINDNCVLVLIPLPLVGCGIGKHPARGDLLDRMHDDSPAAPPQKNIAP